MLLWGRGSSLVGTGSLNSTWLEKFLNKIFEPFSKFCFTASWFGVSLLSLCRVLNDSSGSPGFCDMKAVGVIVEPYWESISKLGRHTRMVESETDHGGSQSRLADQGSSPWSGPCLSQTLQPDTGQTNLTHWSLSPLPHLSVSRMTTPGYKYKQPIRIYGKLGLASKKQITK